MPVYARVSAFLGLFFGTAAYALIRGGRPERRAALMLLAALVLDLALMSPFEQRFHGLEAGPAASDGLLLAGLIWLTLTADRFWPSWLAAMQVLVVFTHLAVAIKPFVLPRYYADTVQLWSYPQVCMLAVGTLRHRLRTVPVGAELIFGRVGARLATWWPSERRR